MTDIEQQRNLSKRDKIMLVMLALVEIDDRLASSGRQNKINFSGTLSESNNQVYLENVYQDLTDWSEEKLLKFALSVIKENLY